ncbi:hypothetical protein FIBSPDRAFT_525894 [Athelia psychrophila]|uniref:Uncharacterized protein n=1 Tax=Athelia psychrophila TaxID=1759441 RepID=A0A166JJG3_9AGAM|nr:hypothetical protein FIBSPDRAFT_525894 [Fibularhizoctonia sp. CBS 109695]
MHNRRLDRERDLPELNGNGNVVISEDALVDSWKVLARHWEPKGWEGGGEFLQSFPSVPTISLYHVLGFCHYHVLRRHLRHEPLFLHLTVIFQHFAFLRSDPTFARCFVPSAPFSLIAILSVYLSLFFVHLYLCISFYKRILTDPLFMQRSLGRSGTGDVFPSQSVSPNWPVYTSCSKLGLLLCTPQITAVLAKSPR